MVRTLIAASLVLSSPSVFAAGAAPAAATYTVEAPKSVQVKKGEKATARVAVVPRADSHVSPDAPVSVAVSGTPSIEVPAPKLGRREAQETARKGVAFDIPFVAREAGPGALDADLIFFICTEKLCERHREHVKLAVRAE